MADELIKMDTILELGPGRSLVRKLNNASSEKAYGANAVPVPIGSITTDGYTEDALVEVTRVWRRMKVQEVAPGNLVDVESEYEVLCEVKNVGDKRAAFRLYFYAIG